jgi:hypothetical protein
MKISKFLRKAYVSLFLASLMLFTSCEGDSIIMNGAPEAIIQKSTFNYSLFENSKGQLLDLNAVAFINSSDFLSKSTSTSTLDQNNLILGEINQKLGTDLALDDSLKSIELTSKLEMENYLLSNQLVSTKELIIIDDFNKNLALMNTSEALKLLERDVNNASLSVFEVSRFETLANTVALLDYQEPGAVTTLAAGGCGEALLGLGFALAGIVGACNPPAAGATVGFFCYLAAANYIRASVAVGRACRK